MTDERTQLRQRAERAEAINAVFRQVIQTCGRDASNSYIRHLCKGTLRAENPGAAILAVAEAARAFLRADPAVENLADLLVALRAAVEEWER